jgi:DNA segregation ATPase FtsK/SpoIIIE-like protein
MSDLKNPQNQTGLREALNTVAQMVMGEEIKAMQDSIRSMEAKLMRQMEDMKREFSAGLDTLQKELAARSADAARSVENVKKSLDTSMTDLNIKIQKSATDLADRVTRSEEQSKKELSAARASLEGRITGAQEHTTQEFKSVRDELVAHQGDLQELRNQSTHHASILAGFAKIFSGAAMFEQPMAAAAPAAPAPAAAPAKPATPPPQPRQQQPAPQPKPQPAPAAMPRKDDTRMMPTSRPQQNASNGRDGGDGFINLPSASDLDKHFNDMFNLGGN